MQNKPLYHDADGGSASSFTHGRSASTALGRPNLTNWELFVRESLQNSWDARDRTSADDGVTFAVEYQKLGRSESDTLRSHVFGHGTQHVLGLRDALAKDNVPLLIVSDSGTTGLRGPTNAAVATEGPSDFNSFVREIGRSAGKEIRGGSYGFGKGVFFTASRSRTILVYTRTTDEHGKRVHRFIAVANDNSYEYDGMKFTGRHWWGKEEEFWDKRTGNSTYFAEPLTGGEADEIAALFRMDRHFTDEKPTGTSVAVIDPDFENSSAEQMEQIARALTRWAWPHMVHTPETDDELRFAVTHNTDDVPVPDPREDVLLKEYVAAYLDSLSVDMEKPEGLDFRRSTEVSSVRSQRPRYGLGRLGLREVPASLSSKTSVIEGNTNAVALMRGPRMVVEYRNGPADRFGRSYVGVFTAAETLDREFALSEPTTHDAWHPRTLTNLDLIDSAWKSTNNPVKIALDHLDKIVSSWGGDPAADKDSPYDAASRKIASMGGDILGSIPGTSMSVKSKPSSRKASGSRSARKLRRETPDVELVNLLPSGDDLYAVFLLSLSLTSAEDTAAFTVEVQVETDTGTTRDWDALGYRPVIENWRPLSPQDSEKNARPPRHSTGGSDSEKLVLSGKDARAVLFVRQQRGLAVSLKVTPVHVDDEEI